MTDIVTINEFKNWVEHFKGYDLKKPIIEVERYGKGSTGRLLLKIKSKDAVSGKVHEYFFCMTKEYPIRTIEEYHKRLQ